MSKSVVALNIDGKSYTGWKTININLSIENLSGSFLLEMATKGGEKDAIPTGSIKPGDPCTVGINGQVVITGYVDKLAPNYNATTHSITIQGRDKAGDLVDSSVINIPGQFLKQRIDAIITTLCTPFGVPVATDTDVGAPLESFSIEQGSTVFQTIQKLCNMRQVLCISDGKGGIKLTRSGNKQTSTQLTEGKNILSGKAEFDWSERFSIYQVKGQKQALELETAENAAEPMGEYTDPDVKRYRSSLTISDGQVDPAVCAAQAKWEGRVKAGKSQRLNITVNGFRENLTGTLWGINKMVQVNAPMLYAQGALLISGVNFMLTDAGELTELSLTSQEAFVTMDISKLKKSQTNPYMLGDDVAEAAKDAIK